ncbi:hypothetical protein PGTUg99_024113 [Puccinia graminis f. sp. tritici]|uniref:Uncharacterized protein n=1 Tax=Puccinia graminis f. sp. tritici TaxID=56615 RepID=A0A5B0S0H2_PUCGR|nr:hypothetical protein PGTUg99_024113 [Puccinia graminis f. sp. tritici]
MNTLSSGGVSPDERVCTPVVYQLAGRDSSRRAGMNTLSSGGVSPDERPTTQASTQAPPPAVLPLLAPGIPWDTRISARFGRKNSHPQPKPHPLAGIRQRIADIRGGLSVTISNLDQSQTEDVVL